ncbi:MAG: phosphopyruvate hydratase [Firmicutes bacterium]|nr:phosphopyruvate hydratase [Bacillota bacterium]
MAKIINIIGREILDSRGNPTVEVELFLDNGIITRSSVPSGASTGSKEALELRDEDESRYHGKGVLKAVNNVNAIIKDNLIGKELDQVTFDKLLLELDGTENKSNLGANAMLAVSLASIKACAKLENKSLYAYLSSGKVNIPIPMINIINGGAHADNNLDIQEFMIVPVVKTIKERVRVASEVFHSLKNILKEQKLNTAVGDEGGFAPNLDHNTLALDFIMKAIMEAGYKPGGDVFIALDVAASELYNKETNTYHIDNAELSSDELIKYYIELVNRYPIMSIEDPFEENDFESMAVLTKLIGEKVMIVGDDYFVTNKKYLEKGAEVNAGNAILLKANQIGTVTEMIKTILLAKKLDYKMIISHRSGETEDTFIADFAVGLSLPYIKTGSMSRGERIAKYNELIRIEEKLMNK